MSCYTVTLIILCVLCLISGCVTAAGGGSTATVAAGVISVLIAALGLYGVLKKKPIALKVFAVLVFIFALLKVIFGSIILASGSRTSDEETTEMLRVGGALIIADGILALLAGILAWSIAKTIQREGETRSDTV